MSQPPLHIPAILLEGDEPSEQAVLASVQKYDLGTAGLVPAGPREPELPPAYGTGQLIVTARDPHCLHAHWDISPEQQSLYNALSVHHHLVVRVYRFGGDGGLMAETHVHPESRRWFLHVPDAATTYLAQLGYYPSQQEWRTLVMSEPVTTPANAPAAEEAAEFATIPLETPLPGAVTAAPTPAPESRPATWTTASVPPAPPVEQIGAAPWPAASPPVLPATVNASREAGVPQPETAGAIPVVPAETAARPAMPPSPAALEQTMDRKEWSPVQERALAELMATSLVRHEWIGSIELEQLIRREMAGGAAPIEGEVPELGLPVPGLQVGPVFSPVGGAEMPAPAGFWFNVNAELVIYGATEPGASVSIGGRAIPLRPDGTFSYRFSLPDGNYELPIVAAAGPGERRAAKLNFARSTRYEGEVGAHPQEPGLKPPAAENLD